MAPSSRHPCTAHPRARAGWSCASCPRELCVDCAVRRKAGTGSVVSCRQCGAFARKLLVAREQRSYARVVWEAFAYPFSSRAIGLMLVAGLVFALLRFVGSLGHALVYGATYSLLFVVIRTTALGHHDVPEAEVVDDPAELFRVGRKAFLALALSLLPLVAYLFASGVSVLGFDAASLAPRFATDPLFYLAALIGIVWTPIALLLAATHSPVSSIINPLFAVKAITKLKGDYVLAVVLFWSIFGASLVVDALAKGFTALVPIPLLASAIAETVKLYLPLVYARVLGLLLYTRGADLGYGAASDYLAPALGDLEPPEEVAAVSRYDPPPLAAAAPAHPAASGVVLARLHPPVPEPWEALPPAPAPLAPASAAPGPWLGDPSTWDEVDWRAADRPTQQLDEEKVLGEIAAQRGK